MAKGWRGGLPDGTVCGQGSTLANTSAIRAWLPGVCERWEINSICDAGAGDLHWIQHVRWDVDYKPFDLIPRHSDVAALDITTENMPPCDAILCRMVLNHLDDKRIEMALDRFRQSSALLLATHFEDGGVKRTRQFTRVDLTRWLGEPTESCPDGHEPNCRLGLWVLK